MSALSAFGIKTKFEFVSWPMCQLGLFPPCPLRCNPLRGFAVGLLVFDVPIVDPRHVDFRCGDLVAQKVNVVFEFFEARLCVAEILDEQFLRFVDVVLEHGVGAEPQANARSRRNFRLGVNLVGEQELGLDRTRIPIRLQVLSQIKRQPWWFFNSYDGVISKQTTNKETNNVMSPNKLVFRRTRVICENTNLYRF